MDNYFIITVTDQEIAREKAKARELRKKQWWTSLVAKGVCHYCEQKVDSSEITMDHVVPIIRGGKSTKGNIVPACKTCNSEKKHMLPIEWAEYLDKLKK